MNLLLEQIMTIVKDSPELYSKPEQGPCYIASEAFYHLAGGKLAGYKPVQGTSGGISHWWVEDVEGCIYDATAYQFNQPFDYQCGRGRGFLTKLPSKRAMKLIEKMIF